MLGDFELFAALSDGRVQLGVLHKDFWNLLVFEDRFPRAFGLTHATVDALFRVDVELIRKLRIVTLELNNAVNRANFHACHVNFDRRAQSFVLLSLLAVAQRPSAATHKQ